MNHPRDEKLTFDEATHTYRIAGLDELQQSQILSVTTFIKTLFPEFNEVEAIQKMKAGKNWNNTNPYWGKSDEEIFAAWDEEKTVASKLGVQMHAWLESYFNKVLMMQKQGLLKEGLILEEYLWPHHDEMIIKKAQFKAFLLKHQHFVPLSMEKRMYCTKSLLAGTTDALFKDVRTNEIHMIDWKRVNGLTLQNPYPDQKGKEKPVEHLTNCDFIHYLIQVNLYKYLLEKYYDIHIASLAIVIFHPEDYYRELSIPIDSDLINELINLRIDNLREDKHKRKFNKSTESLVKINEKNFNGSEQKRLCKVQFKVK